MCVSQVTYRNFEEALLQVDSISLEEFEEKAYAAHHFVKENYTLEKYEENMFSLLKKIIEENK